MAAGIPVAADGVVNITLQPIIAPATGQVLIINAIRFNNTTGHDVDYTIELCLMHQGSSLARRQYRFELDAGDVVVDNTRYELKEGMYLAAVTDQAHSVEFSINGEQQIL
jgi:hypothetical protein